MEKTEGVNYLSDKQYLAMNQPGPEKYKPNVSEISSSLTVYATLVELHQAPSPRG